MINDKREELIQLREEQENTDKKMAELAHKMMCINEKTEEVSIHMNNISKQA